MPEFRPQSALSPLDNLAGTAIDFGGRIARDMFRGLVKLLIRGKFADIRSNPAILIPEALEIINAHALDLQRALADTLIASFLHGASGVELDLPAEPVEGSILEAFFAPTDVFGPRVVRAGTQLIKQARELPKFVGPPLPPRKVSRLIYGDDEPLIRFPLVEEAVKNLLDRNVVNSDKFYKLGADARRHAFTITADLSRRSLTKFRDILGENVATKSSREAFMRDSRQRFKKLPISEAHLEQVFRNNVNSAYSDGTESVLEHPLVTRGFPFRMYFAIRDDRVRVEHRAMEVLGLSRTNIYHRADPVWREFRPPWAWNCRCGWAAISLRDAARAGVKVAERWLRTGEMPPVKEMFVDHPPFEAPVSWRRAA